MRDSPVPAGTLRSAQVHGAAVARVEGGATPRLDVAEADALVSGVPGAAIAVVTADCVPVLACSEDGAAVAAIHAGWRGLAQGVVEAGIEALAELAGPGRRLAAVVGPRIGVCCYEVDEPVLSALEARYAAELPDATRPGAAGHAWLDLGGLVAAALARAGVAAETLGVMDDCCTRCDADRFHSYRRDGEAAGRMTHFIAARAGSGRIR